MTDDNIERKPSGDASDGFESDQDDRKFDFKQYSENSNDYNVSICL